MTLHWNDADFLLPALEFLRDQYAKFSLKSSCKNTLLQLVSQLAIFAIPMYLCMILNILLRPCRDAVSRFSMRVMVAGHRCVGDDTIGTRLEHAIVITFNPQPRPQLDARLWLALSEKNYRDLNPVSSCLYHVVVTLCSSITFICDVFEVWNNFDVSSCGMLYWNILVLQVCWYSGR